MQNMDHALIIFMLKSIKYYVLQDTKGLRVRFHLKTKNNADSRHIHTNNFNENLANYAFKIEKVLFCLN